MMDSGNLRLRAMHPQSHQGVCADAIATLEGITREDVDAARRSKASSAPPNAIKGGHFDKSLVPVYSEDGSARARPRGISRARRPRSKASPG